MSIVTDSDVRYGFIGVGQMGWGMAMNLREKIPKEAKMVICEISQTRRDQFVKEAQEKGAVTTADSPREVAEQSDVVITMLPQGQHVRDVFTNTETGLLSATRPRTTPIHFIDCSTIEVATSVEVGEAVARSGLGTFVDAPVSGGPNGARAGTLAIMVGGGEADWARAAPVLRTMGGGGGGGGVFHCGPAGAGLATKQINNYLSAVSTVGVCEAMNMGVRCGLDPRTLAAAINAGSGRCYNSADQNPVKGVTPGAASARDFAGGFSVELCKGVLDMAVALGARVGAPLVLADRVLALYEKAQADDRTRGLDSRSIYRFFADGDAL
ncbi:putative 3-hydroxyisobutyrate dehydrogenase protein [Rosellinia necatrix]|uniref:Putative 3-hydroxyisobutyrate dehydrogenase protein n=1 Tax=Rosellinia necatrix TaxID=77044 RepID=A0A1W2TGL7_ROSNE|nr:putative 3-hydroxyisobutyrate dehydrogenase protein [Rosellinia necatrix]